MPILTDSTEAVLGGRAIRLQGLPDFNAGDPAFKITEFEGWFDGVAPEAELVANGGGPGAVAVGTWDPVEAYFTISGRVDVASADRATMRRLLLAALPADRDVSVQVIGNGRDADQQVFVRRYDKPGFPPGESVLRFAFDMVATDPYKYGVEPLVASVGAFEILDAFRVYANDAEGGYRTYEDDGSIAYRVYETDEESGSSEPRVAVLESPGTVTSRRVTTTVTGPLTAGDWFIDDDQGNRTWVELTLAAGESVVLESRGPDGYPAATLRGTDISHLMFGPFPKLRPGGNSWRLITNGASGSGHMTIEALWATE